jgi:lipopolysaccharide transport system ATP-binding protein
MSAMAIHAEQLAKRYRLGKRERYPTLRASLSGMASSLLRGDWHSTDDEEWVDALRGVSFDVAAGEIVGIMGRNGAGKSTLLKILSRITEPTGGRAAIRGRLGSLLEVGTGFHPELTGRENVFLNAAILGMPRAETLRQFDAIVAFAEIERFIDTPVKRYSTGMYLRLAFSVAAHLEPDILLVDEVLAVGDASFQRKCLAKIQDVGKAGHTVLLVSHNRSAITRLCPRTILLDAGLVIADGPSVDVVRTYLNSGIGLFAQRTWEDQRAAPGNETVRLASMRVLDDQGELAESIDIHRPVRVEIEYDVLKDGARLVSQLHFYNEEGICAFAASESGTEWIDRPRSKGRYRSAVVVPGNFLSEGSLLVHVVIQDAHSVYVHVRQRDAVAFHVVDRADGKSVRGQFGGNLPGVVRPDLRWETEYAEPRRESVTSSTLRG